MFRIILTWILVASAVIFFIGASFYVWREINVRQTESAMQREHTTEDNKQTARDYLKCLQSSGISVAVFSCNPQAIYAERQAQRAQYDLQAQQDMAVWTYGIFWVSLAGLVVSAFGLVAILYTIELSRQSTRAAIKAVEHTISSERAWLTFKEPRLGAIINTVNNGVMIRNGFGAGSIWKNSGRSPAKNIEFRYRFLFVPIDYNSEKFDKLFGPLQMTSHLPIGPEGEFDGNMRMFDDYSTSLFRERRFKVIMYMHISYRDIFSTDIRETSLAIELVSLGGTIHLAGEDVQPGVSVRPIGEQVYT